jgi:UDP-N-acetylmuramate dehydrogenase
VPTEDLTENHKNDAQIPQIMENVIMSDKTKNGYGIGGTADYFVAVRNAKDIEYALDFAHKKNIPYTILGNGSNFLVSDKGFRGIVISTQRMNSITPLSKNAIRAEAGATVTSLIQESIQAKLPGLEELSGIPGTVGGAIAMNAGAYSQTISDNITQICIYDCNLDKEVIIPKHKARFAYRDSTFKEKNCIILWVDFEFSMEIKFGVLLARQGDVIKKRKADQPIEGRCCGSIFKNPKDGYSAWKLIDDAGLRGFSIGGAQISEKHTNFIVNTGNATAEDVRKIIAEVRKRVNEKFHILLETEVVFLGEFDTQI